MKVGKRVLDKYLINKIKRSKNNKDIVTTQTK